MIQGHESNFETFEEHYGLTGVAYRLAEHTKTLNLYMEYFKKAKSYIDFSSIIITPQQASGIELTNEQIIYSLELWQKAQIYLKEIDEISVFGQVTIKFACCYYEKTKFICEYYLNLDIPIFFVPKELLETMKTNYPFLKKKWNFIRYDKQGNHK